MVYIRPYGIFIWVIFLKCNTSYKYSFYAEHIYSGERKSRAENKRWLREENGAVIGDRRQVGINLVRVRMLNVCWK